MKTDSSMARASGETSSQAPRRTVSWSRECKRLATAAGAGAVLAALGTLVDLSTAPPAAPNSVQLSAAEPQDDPSAPVVSLEGNAYLQPPSATADDLLAFLKAAPNKPSILQRREPFQRAVVDAAERLAKLDVPAEQKNLAIRAKFNALALMREAGIDGAGTLLVAWATDYKDHSDPSIKADATLVFLEEKLKTADLTNYDELPLLLDEVRKYCASQPTLDVRHLELATRCVTVINSIKDDPLAADGYQEFGGLFSKSKNRQLADYGNSLTKFGAKMNFLIKPLEIEGTLLDGAKLDWASYRGKVVLIDFWASWCGPCLAEMPNVKAMYEAYHDKGFEIIGVVKQDEEEDVRNCIAENGLVWPMLFHKDGNHPLAEKYNVRGIPTMILVDKDGKVLKPSVRGERLNQALQAIFGPAPEAAKAEPAAQPAGEAKGAKL